MTVCLHRRDGGATERPLHRFNSIPADALGGANSGHEFRKVGESVCHQIAIAREVALLRYEFPKAVSALRLVQTQDDRRDLFQGQLIELSDEERFGITSPFCDR